MNTRNILPKLNPLLRLHGATSRTLSTSTDNSIASWIQRMTQTPPKTTIDLIDLERAQQLCRVLPTRTGKGQVLPEWGDALSKGHHLVYFWAKSEGEQLGEDGSSTEYNAPYPYTRRMWAGGLFEWPAPPGGQPSDSSAPEGIIIGSSIREQTSVAKIEEKRGMVFVHQLKEYCTDRGRARPLVREVRMHVFRQAVQTGGTSEGDQTPKKTTAKKELPVPSPPYNLTFSFTPSLPLLFRFSALTFNAHRIHYDAAWAREREGHSASTYGGPVVHGPLSALVCVELVERWLETSSEGREKGKSGGMTKFEYRATSPMYVDRKMEVFGKLVPAEGDGEREVLRLWVVQDGKVGMTATAYFG